MKVAIVTGASSGVGKAFVSEIEKNHKDIEQIYLIARRKDKLEEIASSYKDMKFKIIPLDLGSESSYEEFQNILKEEKPEIRLLINSAGLDNVSSFINQDIKYIENMINLNCKGLAIMTRLALPYMSKNSSIIQISSVSAFAPNVRQVVYSATKSFVKAFSLGINEELKKDKINVLTVFPGLMLTEMTYDFTNKKKYSYIRSLPILNVEKVVRNSLKRAKKGKSSYTPGTFYKFYRFMCKILPNKLIVKFAKI